MIGGGVIGCMCAWRLARRGWSVTLLDADAPPAGASAATHSNLSIYNRQPGTELEIALETVAVYRQLEREGFGEVGYRELGGALLIEDPDDIAAAERRVAQQRAAGVPCELVDGDELRRRDPSVGRRAVAAIVSPRSGVVYAPGVCYALLRAAVAAGATVRPFSRVVGAEQTAVGWRVRTRSGPLDSEHVVIAAGTAAGTVAAHFGVELAITPVKGHIAITTRQPRGGVAMMGEFVPADRHSGSRSEVRMVWTHTPEGHIFIGRSSEPGVRDRRVDPDVVRAILSRVRRWIPSAVGLPILRLFTGLRPQGPEGRPIIGPAPERSGVWLAAGLGDRGIGLAAAAKLLADTMTGALAPVLDPYRPPPAAPRV